jgi:hypothetical protein
MGAPPQRGFGQRATSPAATTFEAPTAASRSSHTTPFWSFRPESASHSVVGATPIADTIASASIRLPSSSTTTCGPSPSTCSTVRPMWSVTPWASKRLVASSTTG